jgi:hypothetical protein
LDKDDANEGKRGTEVCIEDRHFNADLGCISHFAHILTKGYSTRSNRVMNVFESLIKQTKDEARIQKCQAKSKHAFGDKAT